MRRAILAVLLLAACRAVGGAAGTDAAWRFVVVGDTQGADGGVNEMVCREIVAAVVEESPEFVLVPGDLVTGGPPERLRRHLERWKKVFLEPLAVRGIPVFPVRGNHDAPKEDRAGRVWRRAFAEWPPRGARPGCDGLSYAFRFREARFVALDLYISGDARRRIDRELLARNCAEGPGPLFVFGHEPLFMPLTADGRAWGPAFRREERDAAAGLIAAEGGVYFCGHMHLYSRAVFPVPGGRLLQVVAGTGGGRLEGWDGAYAERTDGEGARAKRYGYLVVTVAGTAARGVMKLRAVPGVFVGSDSFELSPAAGGRALPRGKGSE